MVHNGLAIITMPIFDKGSSCWHYLDALSLLRYTHKNRVCKKNKTLTVDSSLAGSHQQTLISKEIDYSE